jgi:two-component sensor histidine kinase/ActR/RegA family two-component response regulator
MNHAMHDVQGGSLRILLLEDSSLDAELVLESLQGTGLRHTVHRVVTREDFTSALKRRDQDLILADFVLPTFDGMSALAIARELRPDTPFIFVSGTLGEEIAVEALKRGATDYVLKQRLERLPPTVLRALAEVRERLERQRAQGALRDLLDDRTALLNELDHRVKNNLQLLLSLVSHDMRHADSASVRQALGRVKQRMQALGTVHRDLYRNDGLGTFDAGAFVSDLATDLLASVGRDDVVPDYRLYATAIPSGQAAAVALLLNELMANAILHAYEGRQGVLRLDMNLREGTCFFQLRDDGFTPTEKATTQDRSSGPILNALLRQLDASIEWPHSEAPVMVRVSFPLAS